MASLDFLRIAFVGDYLPRKCGIATFTHDLRGAIAMALRRRVHRCARGRYSRVAMNTRRRCGFRSLNKNWRRIVGRLIF